MSERYLIDDVKALLPKVEQASEPSRELDAQTYLTFYAVRNVGQTVPLFVEMNIDPPNFPVDKAPWLTRDTLLKTDGTGIPYTYSSSVDDAIALIEDIAPDCTADVLREAVADLSQQNRWATTFYKKGQFDVLALTMLKIFLTFLIEEEDES